jgi:hypothetical protein
LAGIWRFTAKAGVPEAVAWSRLVAASRKNSNGEWIANHSEFLDRRLLQKYYSKDKLLGEPARITWVPPELAPLG